MLYYTILYHIISNFIILYLHLYIKKNLENKLNSVLKCFEICFDRSLGLLFGGFFHPKIEHIHSFQVMYELNIGIGRWTRTLRQYSYIFISLWTSWSTTGGLTNFNMFFQQGILATKTCLKFSMPLCIYASVCRYVIWNAQDIFHPPHQPPSHHWGLHKKNPTCTIHVRSASRWNVPKEMMLWSGIYWPPAMMAPKPPPPLKK